MNSLSQQDEEQTVLLLEGISRLPEEVKQIIYTYVIINNKCPARFKEEFGGCAEAFSIMPGNIGIQIRNGQRKVIPSDCNIRPSYVKWL